MTAGASTHGVNGKCVFLFSNIPFKTDHLPVPDLDLTGNFDRLPKAALLVSNLSRSALATNLRESELELGLISLVRNTF